MEDTSTIAEFIKQQREEFVNFRKALTNETDRGCALFAAAYLDKSLSDLLFVSFVENKKVENDLFEGLAPLSSFSARIKMAYYLGKISAACRGDLDLIRKIRNDFAHDATPISFDEKSIAARCRSLQYSYHTADDRPRAHFTAAACGILAILHGSTLTTSAPTEKPDDRPTDAKKAELRKQVEATLTESGPSA